MYRTPQLKKDNLHYLRLIIYPLSVFGIIMVSFGQAQYFIRNWNSFFIYHIGSFFVLLFFDVLICLMIVIAILFISNAIPTEVSFKDSELILEKSRIYFFYISKEKKYSYDHISYFSKKRDEIFLKIDNRIVLIHRPLYLKDGSYYKIIHELEERNIEEVRNEKMIMDGKDLHFLFSFRKELGFLP